MFKPGKANEFGELTNATAGTVWDSGQHAIDAWESEGGSPAEKLGGFDWKRNTLADNAGWRASNNDGWLANHPGKDTSSSGDAQADSLADNEDRILRCLGAAVVMRWNTLSAKLQRELFDNASSLGDLLEADALKGQIARFLHRNKDQAG